MGLDHNIVRSKEEAMMVCATQFMGALQEMSLAVHRIIETACSYDY